VMASILHLDCSELPRDSAHSKNSVFRANVSLVERSFWSNPSKNSK